MLEPEDYEVPEDRDPVKLLEPDSNGEYDCPVCGEYTGERGSVEAHITGKSDEDHKGLVGKDFRYQSEDDLVLGDRPMEEPKPINPNGNDSGEASQESDPDQVSNTGSLSEFLTGSVQGTGIILLAGVVWWLAKQSGNENEVRDVWDNA